MTVKQITGLRNRISGEKMEQKIHKKVRSGMDVLTSCRSSGSFGLFDIWVLRQNKLRLVSCKKNGYWTHKEKRDLKEFLVFKPDFVQCECWWYRNQKHLTKIILKRKEDVDRL